MREAIEIDKHLRKPWLPRGFIQHLMKTDAQTHSHHQVVLSESRGRVGDRIEQAGGVRDTRRPTESTPGQGGVTETEPQPKSTQGLNLDPQHFCTRCAEEWKFLVSL